jgi:hypothetical protein
MTIRERLKKIGKVTIIALALLAILISQPLILGYTNYNGNTSYLFSFFGLVPKYSFVDVSKNGMEVIAYNYSAPQMNITLYNYSNETFDCYGVAGICDIENSSGYRLVFSIHSGDNTIIMSLLPTLSSSPNLNGLGILFMLRNPYEAIYQWTVSEENLGQVSYRPNPLISDKISTVQDGFVFSQQRFMSTFFYWWLPVLLIFAIGFYVYRKRRQVEK